VPIPQTSYTVGLSGGATGGYLPATSFTYKNVGVNLAITPRVAATGDVSLEMAAEFSLLGDDRNVGSDTNKILVPTFFTRNVTGVLRLRDGETGLIGGLVQGREASSFAGVIGMNDIPVIGKLFGTRQHTNDTTEVIMSITPRVVRAPKVTDDDLIALRVGTQEVPRVEGARPPLFGEPEGPPQEEGQGAGGATQAPPPQGAGAAPQGRLGPTQEEHKATTGPGSQARPPATTPPAPVPPPFPELEPPPANPPNTSPATPPPSPAQPPPSASAQPAAPGSPAAAPQQPAAGAQSTAAQASSATVLLSPPEVALKVGQAGTLAVVLVGAKDVQSVEINLSWDPNVADVTDVAPGSLLTLDGTPITVDRAIESGHARVRFARATGAVGSGAVASITIRGAKVGSGPVAVESLVLGRTGGQDQPGPPSPGRIVVAP
jgi:general secretion pathway protein D